MPIYDYHCDHCGHAFSAIQRFADDALAACPSCGKPPRRLRSNPALVFKGSGWYKTDSRGKDKSDTGGDTGKDKDKKDKDKDTKDKKHPSDVPAAAGKSDGATGEGSAAAAPAAPAAAPAKAPEKAAPASS